MAVMSSSRSMRERMGTILKEGDRLRRARDTTP